jgi:hypothetical protein
MKNEKDFCELCEKLVADGMPHDNKKHGSGVLSDEEMREVEARFAAINSRRSNE